MDDVVLKNLFQPTPTHVGLTGPDVTVFDLSTLNTTIPPSSAEIFVPLSFFPSLALETAGPVLESAGFCYHFPAGNFFGNTLFEIFRHTHAYQRLHHWCCEKKQSVGMAFHSDHLEARQIWSGVMTMLCGDRPAPRRMLVWMEKELLAREMWDQWETLVPKEGVFVYRVTDLGLGLRMASAMSSAFEKVEWCAPVQSGFPYRWIYLIGTGFSAVKTPFSAVYSMLTTSTLDGVRIKTAVRDTAAQFLNEWRHTSMRNIYRSNWLSQYFQRTGPSQVPVEMDVFRKLPLAVQFEQEWLKYWHPAIATHEPYRP